MPEVSASDWDTFLLNFPDVHLLQTSAWGELKSAFGWQPSYFLVKDKKSLTGTFGAMVLFRRLPLGFTLAYIPKGPVGDGKTGEGIPSWEALWPDVDALCRRKRAVFLKVEPDLWETSVAALPEGMGASSPGTQQQSVIPGFQRSEQDIQPSRTLLVDLSGGEEEVLARMKQKTRYNVRLALKKGVVAFPSSELDLFYGLMLVTGRRDFFGVHSLEYYRKAYELFHPRGECVLLIAAYQGEPIAGIMVFAHGKRAWYFYGASADENRERMPAYLLQWEAMRWARAQGCSTYDLWGVPDAEESILEAQFSHRSEGLWGVYRFKRGFGGQLRRSVGSWDRVFQPVIYAFYRWWAGKRVRD
jgi:peptidoglycan pentaglycine glycine transferase (the first glycine)